ncbi:MAG: ubiquinol-cytochrome c reductase iron-sulfur subunit [Rhodospirillaceae bacterium]
MANTAHAAEPAGETRRDFLLHSTVAVGAVGTAMMLWPLIDSMNPAADTLSLSTTEFSVAGIAEGSRIVIVWRGTPVFVSHRTPAEIDAARKVNVSELRDPQKDEARVQKPEFLIVSGVCTHLGCVPLGSKATDPRGEFGGWFCPCHGSQYDTSGRIRLGPAPKNLEVPPYKFTGDTVLVG